MANRSGRDNQGVTFISQGDRIKGLPWTGISTVGCGINNDGWVVEHRNYKYSGPEFAAWVWVGDRRVPIVDASGLMGRFASGINRAGVATGTTLGGLFRFDAGTGDMEHLPEPVDLEYEARAIADTGVVVGPALHGLGGADLSFQALVWRPGAAHAELLTLPDTHSHAAEGVNVHGTLCGWYTRGENLPKRAFTWRDGVLIDLGDRLGVTGSRPFCINADGWIAGEVYPQVSRSRRQFAALWVGDEAFMLNDLLHPGSAGWDLRTAVAVNARGQIVGEGVVGNHRRAYIATPA
jgi:probable HAF family extracellular repeat protein